jgi:hypothetical protein
MWAYMDNFIVHVRTLWLGTDGFSLLRTDGENLRNGMRIMPCTSNERMVAAQQEKK